VNEKFLNTHIGVYCVKKIIVNCIANFTVPIAKKHKANALWRRHLSKKIELILKNEFILKTKLNAALKKHKTVKKACTNTKNKFVSIHLYFLM
jgi:hypothetical protein